MGDPIIDPVNSGNATETFKKALEILGMHYTSRTGMEVEALRIGSSFGPLYLFAGRAVEPHMPCCGDWIAG